jgi:hypothetical protein
MQEYYVYENWMTDRAIIHRAECSFCKDGKGAHNDASGLHGRWHGPYPDRNMAFKEAAAMKRRKIPNVRKVYQRQVRMQ